MIVFTLFSEIQIRRHARQEGNERSFLSTRQELIHFHIHRMPEPLRLSPGSIKPEQLAIYDDYARNIPGFVPTSDYKPMRRTMPKVNHWLSDNGVRFYGEVLESFYEDVKSKHYNLV